MIEIPSIKGLNVYNPSNGHLLLLATAPVVHMAPGNGRFEPGFYPKKSLSGPVQLVDGGVVYNVAISNVHLNVIKFRHKEIEVPAHGAFKPPQYDPHPHFGDFRDPRNRADIYPNLDSAKYSMGRDGIRELKHVLKIEEGVIMPMAKWKSLVFKLFTYKGEYYKVAIHITRDGKMTVGEALPILFPERPDRIA